MGFIILNLHQTISLSYILFQQDIFIFTNVKEGTIKEIHFLLFIFFLTSSCTLVFQRISCYNISIPILPFSLQELDFTSSFFVGTFDLFAFNASHIIATHTSKSASSSSSYFTNSLMPLTKQILVLVHTFPSSSFRVFILWQLYPLSMNRCLHIPQYCWHF